MKQVAQEMGEVGLGQLGAAASEMAEGLKGGQGAVSRRARTTLAKLVEGHSVRRKIKEILDIEARKLSECKGKCNCDKTARIRMPTKSDSPSENWGAGDQRQRLRPEDRPQGQPRAEGDHRQPRRRPVRGRDDPFRRGTAARRAAVSRALPEIPQDVRGRARQRADPARPARDDPPLLRADPTRRTWTAIPRERMPRRGRRRGPTGDRAVEPRCPTPVPIVVPTRVTARRSTRRPGRRCGPRWPTSRGSWSGGTLRFRASSWWVTGIH